MYRVASHDSIVPQSTARLSALVSSALDDSDGTFNAFREPIDSADRAHFQDSVEDTVEKAIKVQGSSRTLTASQECGLRVKAALLHAVHDGVEMVYSDGFTKCFARRPSQPWNWNFYLMPLWLVGVVVRYCILFPIRLALLVGGCSIILPTFFLLGLMLPPSQKLMLIQSKLISAICGLFVLSWTAVIRYHGHPPRRRPNQVFVANHTSMIDYIILQQHRPFASVSQRHPGWVGFLQNRVLSAVGSVSFDRKQTKDRKLVAQRLREHISKADNLPLLLFPEGTCVNNEYCVMFKKGAFELGAQIIPVAIKYNKIFVDAFWHSGHETFAQYLLRLMTSWAVVCDVWYMDPMDRLPGESAEDFSARVKRAICAQAELLEVPFDGYYKYFRPSERMINNVRRIIAASLLPLTNVHGHAARPARGAESARAPASSVRQRGTARP